MNGLLLSAANDAATVAHAYGGVETTSLDIWQIILGVATLLMTSAVALFTGLSWFSSRHGMRPAIRVELERDATINDELEMRVRLKNRRPLPIDLFQVELLEPRDVLEISEYSRNQLRIMPRHAPKLEIQPPGHILNMAQTIEPDDTGKIDFRILLAKDSSGFKGYAKIAIRWHLLSQNVKRKQAIIKRKIDLRRK
jgi:hypothetical protein